jgi:hypothetical protein
MRKSFVALGLLCACVACSLTPRFNPANFGDLRDFDADGLKLRLPAAFKRFAEDDAVLFRPEPPVRPSPGVLVKREDGGNTDKALAAAYQKIVGKMGGAPLAIRGTIGGREAKGWHDQLVTHFLWIYATTDGQSTWLLQILAPVEWTDDQALAFHDLVCRDVKLAE